MFRLTSAFLLCLTASLVQNGIAMVQGAELRATRLLHTFSSTSSDENRDDMSSVDDDQIYPADNDDDFGFPWVLGKEGCDEGWAQIKQHYEENMELWANPSCYSYELQYIDFGEDEALRPIRVFVVDGIVDHVEDVEDPSSIAPSPYIPLLTMNEMFDDIKEKCFQDCPEKGSPGCLVQFDTLYGAVDLYITESLMTYYYYQVMNFQPCDE
jgi:Family of unknown function (DUF6174)